MGLDDIDEDEGPSRPPVTHAPNGNVGALDDLFGGLGVSVQPPPHRAPPADVFRSSPSVAASSSSVIAPAADPLDMLFSGVASGPSSSTAATSARSAAPVPDDLFDFSKPTVQKTHADDRTFLEQFETGGRSTLLQKPSLQSLSKGGPSTNRVTASLLQLMNYYDVLGVTPTSSTDDIKRQYKKKALELHPDKVGSSQTAEEAALFKVITKAHEVLADDAKRAEYDQQLCRSGGHNNWLQHIGAQ